MCAQQVVLQIAGCRKEFKPLAHAHGSHSQNSILGLLSASALPCKLAAVGAAQPLAVAVLPPLSATGTHPMHPKPMPRPPPSGALLVMMDTAASTDRLRHELAASEPAALVPENHLHSMHACRQAHPAAPNSKASYGVWHMCQRGLVPPSCRRRAKCAAAGAPTGRCAPEAEPACVPQAADGTCMAVALVQPHLKTNEVLLFMPPQPTGKAPARNLCRWMRAGMPKRGVVGGCNGSGALPCRLPGVQAARWWMR